MLAGAGKQRAQQPLFETANGTFQEDEGASQKPLQGRSLYLGNNQVGTAIRGFGGIDPARYNPLSPPFPTPPPTGKVELQFPAPVVTVHRTSGLALETEGRARERKTTVLVEL